MKICLCSSVALPIENTLRTDRFCTARLHQVQVIPPEMEESTSHWQEVDSASLKEPWPCPSPASPVTQASALIQSSLYYPWALLRPCVGFWNEVLIGSSGFLPRLPSRNLRNVIFRSDLRLWTEWFFHWRLCLVWSPFNFKKARCGCCFGRVAGQWSRELSQLPGRSRLQDFSLCV